jgi:hypothetical protein
MRIHGERAENRSKPGKRSYPIFIGAGRMQLKAEFDRPSRRDILLVTNTTVGPLYAAKLPPRLRPDVARGGAARRRDAQDARERLSDARRADRKPFRA